MGRHLEDFTPGMSFESHGRTITEADVTAFAGITGDFNPLHVDETFARRSAFGGRIAHGPLSVGMAFGLLGRHDLFEGTVLALRRVEWSFDAPVRLGDTVRLVAEVTDVSPHPRDGDRGRLTFSARYFNQNDDVISRGSFTVVIKRRPGSTDKANG